MAPNQDFKGMPLSDYVSLTLNISETIQNRRMVTTDH